MLPSPLRLTSFPSTKSFNRPDARDVTFQPSVGTVGRRRWRYGIFGPSTPFSPEVDSWEFYHRNMLLNLKIPEKELWKWEFLWILAMIQEKNAQDININSTSEHNAWFHLSRPMDPSNPLPRLALPPNNGSLWPNRGPGPLGNLWGFFCGNQWGVPAPGVGG